MARSSIPPSAPLTPSPLEPKPFSPVAQLFEYPFRIFFLLTGVYAILSVPAWIIYLFAGMPLPVGWSAFHWHSHEMLFGFVAPAVTGFVLTAVCNWTGSAPLRGRWLFGLALLWLAGRVVMWTASWWPLWLVAVVDALFLAAVALYLTCILLGKGNRKNLILAAAITLLFLANIVMHMGFMTGATDLLQAGVKMAFTLIALLIVIIGGRIIPLFTSNWLRNEGRDPGAVRVCGKLDIAVLVITAAMLPADLLPGNLVVVSGVVALLAGILNLIRWWRWNGRVALKEPLLWVLHLGYAWLVLGLFFKAGAVFGIVAQTAWLHTLGVGGMALLIVGVMTRVSLGHTGRPMKLPLFAQSIYYFMVAAAVARVLVALQWLDFRFGVILAGGAWTISFALFIWFYWPILSAPRVDGRPG